MWHDTREELGCLSAYRCFKHWLDPLESFMGSPDLNVKSINFDNNRRPVVLVQNYYRFDTTVGINACIIDGSKEKRRELNVAVCFVLQFQHAIGCAWSVTFQHVHVVLHFIIGYPPLFGPTKERHAHHLQVSAVFHA